MLEGSSGGEKYWSSPTKPAIRPIATRTSSGTPPLIKKRSSSGAYSLVERIVAALILEEY